MVDRRLEVAARMLVNGTVIVVVAMIVVWHGGLAPIFRRVLDLLEARAAIDAGAGEQIRFGRNEFGRQVRVLVEMLNDDPFLADRKIDDVARLPVMLHAVD